MTRCRVAIKGVEALACVDLELVVPREHADFQGERIEGRLQQLAKLTGKRLAFRFE